MNADASSPFPAATLQDIERLQAEVVAAHFTPAALPYLQQVLGYVQRLYAGEYPGYQKCDLPYHDFVHACDATMAFLRMIDGHQKRATSTRLSAREFQLGVSAVLLHDAGYLKENGDEGGTGAKHTLTHVVRGIGLAAKLLPPLGVTPDELRLVQLLIGCTGLDAAPRKLPLANPRQYYLACAVATADLLGQMASADYPGRLKDLFAEFQEAAAVAHSTETNLGGYASVESLMRRSRSFYQQQVRELLEVDWNHAYQDLTSHFADGQNRYLKAIEFNLARIDEMLAAPAGRNAP